MVVTMSDISLKRAKNAFMPTNMSTDHCTVKIQKVKSTHILIIDFLTILRGKDFQDVIKVLLDIIKGLIKV